MHFIIFPLSFIFAPVRPFVHPLPVNVIVLKFALEARAVCPVKQSLAYHYMRKNSTVFLAFLVLTGVFSSVGPGFYAFALLFVIFPVAFELSPIGVLVNTIAMGLVGLPVALVDIAVGVDETAFAVGLVVPPVAFKVRPVLPDLNASAVTLAIFPLALIDGPVFELNESKTSWASSESSFLSSGWS